MSNSFTRLQKTLSRILSIEKDKITIDSHFTNDLGADSIQLIEIIMGIEDEFDVEITDAVAVKIKSVRDALSYLEK